MKNITNMINNIDKPVEEQIIDVRLTYKELWAIRGLAQNPHEAMQDNLELMEQAEILFKSINLIMQTMQPEIEDGMPF